MTPKIALLACQGTLAASGASATDRRPDAYLHDRQLAVLRAGLQDAAEVVELDWRAPLDVIRAFPLVLIGSPWDYTGAKEEFLAALAAIEAAGCQLCNPLEVVRWNADKLYLREMAEKGVPSIPTLWSETPAARDINQAFDHFGCERVVAKRRVGAGAEGQVSFTRGDPAIAAWRMDQPAMIQPFLPAIASEGELSFVFIDGAFTHALIKRAKPGDYRIQSVYGGTETPITPTASDLAAAQRAMAALPFAQPPLYARIDMLRLPDGQLALIEAELIEPYLYPPPGDDFALSLAQAVLRRLTWHTSRRT